jgi:hypothetical protein
MYDDTCRFLAEHFSTDFASWLLGEAAQIIDQIADPTTQPNLMAASGILAGLKLEEDVIYRLLRRDIMQESVIIGLFSKKQKPEQPQNRKEKLLIIRYGKDYRLKSLLV